MQWLAQKRGKLRLLDATTKLRGRFADFVDGTDEVFHQFLDVVSATVGQIPLG
jgi:hypothetical protein